MSTRDRRIGPIGTAARIVLGAALVIVPIALGGITWLDVATLALFAAIAAPTMSAIAALLQRYRPGHGAGCAVMCALLAEASGLGALIPANLNVVVGSFLGISLLLAAVRGDAGCEVLALPNVITGRRDRIGCVFLGPIDAVDTVDAVDAVDADGAAAAGRQS